MQKLIDLNERFNDQADLIQDTRSLLLNSSILQISHDNDEVIIHMIIVSYLVRVSIQGVKSLGGHFACLCRGFEFYEVKKR
jgi:hypothetical protein